MISARRLVAQPVHHPEPRQRVPVGRGVGHRLEYVESAQREHSGNSTEDTRPVARRDRDDSVHCRDLMRARVDALEVGRVRP